MLTKTLNSLVDNGWLQGIAGVMLLISVFTSFIALHHGLILIGVSHVFSVIPNIVQSLERIQKYVV